MFSAVERSPLLGKPEQLRQRAEQRALEETLERTRHSTYLRAAALFSLLAQRNAT